jgi:hypothetical protein
LATGNAEKAGLEQIPVSRASGIRLANQLELQVGAFAVGPKRVLMPANCRKPAAQIATGGCQAVAGVSISFPRSKHLSQQLPSRAQHCHYFLVSTGFACQLTKIDISSAEIVAVSQDVRMISHQAFTDFSRTGQHPDRVITSIGISIKYTEHSASCDQ